MGVAAAGIGLHGQGHGLPGLAQPFHRLVHLRVGRIGAQEPGLALDRFMGAAEAFAGEGRRDEPVHGRVSHLEKLGPAAVHEKLHRSRRLAQADAEGARHLLRRQAEHPRRRRRRAEGAARGRRVKSAHVVVLRHQRQAETDLHLEAGDDGGDHVAPAGARHFRRGQGRRHDGRAGMEGRPGMGVVEVEGMDQRPVEERRAGGRVAGLVADDARFSPRQPQPFHRGDQTGRRRGVVAGADGDADAVRHQQLGALAHLVRQALVGRGGDEFGKPAGDPAHGQSSHAVLGGQHTTNPGPGHKPAARGLSPAHRTPRAGAENRPAGRA